MINQIVSIIGDSYFEPIFVLIERLERCKKMKNGVLGAGYYENGYSASICILIAAVVESYVSRVKYIQAANAKQINEVSAINYLLKEYTDFPYKNEITELFILRDCIIHNHLWEIDLNYGDEGVEANKRDQKSSGDKKYNENVDLQTRKTKQLGLNVVPINVSRNEVKTALRVMLNVLEYLEKKDCNLCNVSHNHQRFKGKMRSVENVVKWVELNI
jgi:hypothetical protein